MKRTLQGLLLGVSLWLADVYGIATVVAQDAAPAGNATPKSSVVTTTTSGSNQIIEYGMVILMFGAALFAICRSSRRNV